MGFFKRNEMELEEVKGMAITRTGTIKKLKDVGHYGFIREKNGSDIFFHGSAVVSPSFKTLKEGNTVEFLAVETAKGTKAVGIVVIDNNQLNKYGGKFK